MRFLLHQFVPPGQHYHVARVDYRTRSVCEIHSHDFAELFYIEAGRGEHRINGTTTRVQRGDVVLIRPDDAHGFAAPKRGGFTMVNVAFDRAVVDHIRERYFDDQPDWPGAGDHMPATWRLGDGGIDQLTHLSLGLSRVGQRRIELECFLLSALNLLTAAPSAVNAPQPQWLRDAIAAFTDAEDITAGVGLFVELAGKSTEHVNRVVRQTMDMTTTDLVRNLRLDRAAHLLRMSTQPIIDVALDSGFDNLGYFYRCFRARFGQTPRRFRIRAHGIAAAQGSAGS